MDPKRHVGWESIYPATCFCQLSRRREPCGPEADLGQPQGLALRRDPGDSRIWLSAFSQEDSIDRLWAVGPLLSERGDSASSVCQQLADRTRTLDSAGVPAPLRPHSTSCSRSTSGSYSNLCLPGDPLKKQVRSSNFYSI